MSTRILIAEPLHFSPAAVDILRQAGTVELRACNRTELAAAIHEYDVIWVRLAHRVDRELLQGPVRCKILAVPTTGLDHIDLEYCAQQGIRVLSLRGETEFLRDVRATAELTLALALALLRHLPAAITSTRKGHWDRDLFRGRELYGKTVGLVGVGRLGSLVAGYFRAFGAEVLGHDPRPDFPTALAERVDSLPELLERSDIISLHVSYDESTRYLIGRDELALMRPDSLLINTSRGGVVDDSALLDALREQRIAGAALDVLDGEPDIQPDHPLLVYAREHDDLIVAPHIGGSTLESFAKTEMFLSGRIVKALAAMQDATSKGAKS